MSFIPNHLVVGPYGAPNTAFVLHGILGSAQNLQGFARKLQATRPEWCFVLVDVRGHAGSRRAPPEHTLAACADDLVQLARHLGRPPRALIGHSFGGKVCLQYAQETRPGLEQLWLLDSNPNAVNLDGSEVYKVLAAARSLALPISSRSDVAQAMRDHGLGDRVAAWMTTNLRMVGENYEWSLDFSIIDALLRDYCRLDFLPFMEAAKPHLGVHWVVGEHSDRVGPALRDYALSLLPSTNVRAHVLPNAGHWVHVDNPAGLVELMGAHFLR